MPFSDIKNLSLASKAIRAKTFSVSLHSRHLGRADSLPGQSWATILLEEGQAFLTSETGRKEFEAPVVICLLWTDNMRLTITPGTSGVFLNLSTDALQNAVGYRAESTELRRLFERRTTRKLDDDNELRVTVETCLKEIVQETNENADATGTVTEAYLRILLVRLWRAVSVELDAQRPKSPQVDLYNRFVSLAQQHFRERWSVSDYAETLGISRDRLGDICRAASGQSPKLALDTRLLIEAKLLIEHSNNSIEQIAGILGFPSPSHFTRFFTRMAKVPPSTFRNEMMWIGKEGESLGKAAMHEWP